MWRESERISVFWLSGTKLVWTSSCGCAQTRGTATMGTAHRRGPRWISEENRDWEWRADRSGDGEEMRESRTTAAAAKEAWCTRAQDRHGKTDYQQEKSLPTTVGRIQNWKTTIHTSATQNRDVSINTTSILTPWAFFTQGGNGLNVKTEEGAVWHNSKQTVIRIAKLQLQFNGQNEFQIHTLPSYRMISLSVKQASRKGTPSPSMTLPKMYFDL